MKKKPSFGVLSVTSGGYAVNKTYISYMNTNIIFFSMAVQVSAKSYISLRQGFLFSEPEEDKWK